MPIHCSICLLSLSEKASLMKSRVSRHLKGSGDQCVRKRFPSRSKPYWGWNTASSSGKSWDQGIKSRWAVGTASETRLYEELVKGKARRGGGGACWSFIIRVTGCTGRIERNSVTHHLACCFMESPWYSGDSGQRDRMLEEKQESEGPMLK